MAPETKAKSRRWYSAGLQFECQPDCGACCTNHDDYAYVYVSDSEVDEIAAHLGLERGAFLDQHTQLDDDWRVLRMDRPECPFLQGQRCGIYAVRPSQCRTFPFWSENLRNRKSWSRLGDWCPGIGQGERVESERIERNLSEADAQAKES